MAPLGAHFAGSYACLFNTGTTDVSSRGFSRLLASLCSSELPVVALKHRKATVALTQAQYPAPGMLDHAGSLEHHFLHHRLDASALGRVTQGFSRLLKYFLTGPIRKTPTS